MATVVTRWNTVRLERKLSKALARAAGNNLEEQFDRVARDVAHETSQRILDSGRGGDWNSMFANIERRVFRAKSGRYNILVGWLNPPPEAHERGGGGRLWFQYQDSGFHLFGGPNWIEGVGATIDQRERLIGGVRQVLGWYVHDVADVFNRG